ncbi:uncharacterized protein DEA37_0014282 [Paragonimus westermani]|uniref:Uncharacterized protein n=1 Tax=Paragonimus westermani TaxID=34504 RepID=A0A5J4NWX7_9TREM|nr:uncharacterized protein DEA37_0014282 [Paragonimus westermani]
MSRYVLFLFFPVFIGNIGVYRCEIQRYWLDYNAEVQVRIHQNTVGLFCFPKPGIRTWLSYCLKDFHIVIQRNDSDNADTVYQSEQETFIVVDNLFDKHLPTVSSCTSIEELAFTHKPSGFLSFLFGHSNKETERTKSVTMAGLELIQPSFPPSCFAICKTSLDLDPIPTLFLTVKSNYNLQNVAKSLFGVLTLLLAGYFSTTIGFYYVSGVSLAIMGSFLILMIILIRILPLHRSGAILQGIFVILGGTLSFFCIFIDYLRSSVVQILSSNAEVTFLYVVIVIVVSLLFFYWFHLPERLINKFPRTKTIMKYLLRVCGAFLLITSVYLPVTDEELIDGFRTLLPQLVGTSVHRPLVDIVHSFSPKFFKLGLVVAIVVTTDLVEYFYHFLSPVKIESAKYTCGFDSGIHHAMFLPGQPFAASSPNEYRCVYQPHNATNKMSTSRPVSTRELCTHDFGYEEMSAFYDCRLSDCYCSPRMVHKRNIIDDILTDDESE